MKRPEPIEIQNEPGMAERFRARATGGAQHAIEELNSVDSKNEGAPCIEGAHSQGKRW
jgi:hypothetical protein